ncbi:PAS domain S-box protein [bacterium]|nr:PAS domain S-box protein [bacterium]
MNQVKILIVEDETIIAMSIESMLQGLGYQVTSIVNTGEKAIEKAETDKPDIILMDIRIKGRMDGIEAAEVIRTRFETPVIFSTAYLDEERIERAKITMPFGYILKPIQERDLKVTIEMALYVAKVGAKRKRAEAETEKSEIKYRSLVEFMPQGMFETDEFGNLIFANRAALEMFSYTESDLAGSPNFLQMIAPEDQERAIANVSKVMSGQQFGGIEYSAITRNGKKFSVMVYSSVISQENKLLHKGIVIDITEHKKAEKKFQELEEKYETAFKTSPDAVNINRLDGLYIDINDGFTQLTGFTREDVMGKLASKINIWAIPEDRVKLLEILKEKGFVKNLESTFRCKDGSYKTALMSASIIMLNDEPHILSVTRDISERRQIEEALQQSEEKYRTLFETMVMGVVYQDAEGRITDANPAAERILGLSLSQMQGRASIDPRWKAIHEDGSDFPGENHPAMVALKTGRKITNVKMGIFHPQKEEYRWININAVPKFRQGGNTPCEVYTVFDDITELKTGK